MKNQNILIAHPSDENELGIIKAFFEALKIKFEITQEHAYESEFVSKIQKSRTQAAEGKTVKISLDEIWK